MKKRFSLSDKWYYFSRSLIIRLYGLVILISNLIAFFQSPGLVGPDGILPPQPFLRFLLHRRFNGSTARAWLHTPSLFWFIPLTTTAIRITSLIGATTGTLLLLIGGEPHTLTKLLRRPPPIPPPLQWSPCTLVLISFFIQHSHPSVGQEFYGFGWETQLIETGFLVLLLTLPPLTQPDTTPIAPHPLTLWLLRWLSFRIALGAGLIKLRAGGCWATSTCLYYHFETQPCPSPTSWLFHHLPHTLHRIGVTFDFTAQLYTPWLLLTPPQPLPCIGGLIQIALMGTIAASGNLSFLNLLTVIPALAAVPDAVWGLGAPYPTHTGPRPHTTHHPVASCVCVGAWSLWPRAWSPISVCLWCATSCPLTSA